MKPFMDQDFLLHSETARKLYHEAAETMPILDYHCHISPKEIAALSPAMLRIRKNSSNGQRFLAEQSAIHSITGVIWNYSVTLTITAF